MTKVLPLISARFLLVWFGQLQKLVSFIQEENPHL